MDAKEIERSEFLEWYFEIEDLEDLRDTYSFEEVEKILKCYEISVNLVSEDDNKDGLLEFERLLKENNIEVK